MPETLDFSQPLSRLLNQGDALVSVIIPSYNKALFLRESVESAIKQDYKNLEIIIVNDGSTDNTNEVARTLINEYPQCNIKLLEKANGGISDARNYAIERASGRIIMCLDGDDIALPTFVSQGVSAMRDFGANMICCNVQTFGAESKEWIPEQVERYGLRYNNNIPTLVLYDKALWQKTGGYKKAFAFDEDWEFFINCSRHDLKLKKLDQKLFHYRVTTDGLAHEYIKDNWPRGVSLMITSNDDLYPVETVLWAHEQLKHVSDKWRERFERQHNMYQNEWILKLWLGLAAEGRQEFKKAFDYYHRIYEITNGQNWQAMFRIALHLEHENPRQSALLFHTVRTSRPDMERFVKERLETLAKS